MSDQVSVAAYHLQGGGASDHIIVKPRIRIDDTKDRVVRRGHVEPNGCAAVDEKSITPRADKERNVLVRPLRIDSVCVVVPHFQPLAALVEVGEFLAKAIEVLIRGGVVCGYHTAVLAADAKAWSGDALGDVNRPRLLRQQSFSIGADEGDVKGIEVYLNG